MTGGGGQGNIEACALGHAGIAQGLDHLVNRSLANRHLAYERAS